MVEVVKRMVMHFVMLIVMDLKRIPFDNDGTTGSDVNDVEMATMSSRSMQTTTTTTARWTSFRTSSSLAEENSRTRGTERRMHPKRIAQDHAHLNICCKVSFSGVRISKCMNLDLLAFEVVHDDLATNKEDDTKTTKSSPNQARLEGERFSLQDMFGKCPRHKAC
uniref:Uncharacterized protein n=1 Tax=Chaetoceros debilis TaxID=122233 RepID=A0A6S8VXS5_9STRA